MTNDVSKLELGQGQYSFLLNDRGGVIDDLIIYRTDPTSYFLVVNASKVDEDFAWLRSHAESSGITLTNRSDDFGGLAIQGPNSVDAFLQMTDDALKESEPQLPERFCIRSFETKAGGLVMVCRTGYTGEDGFELFCPIRDAETWWRRTVSSGATPCGLGARDILRLEKCYPLNGSDLSPELTPLQAGMSFAVDLEKGDFIGRDVLLKQKAEGLDTKLVALKQTEKSPPPRHGYPVFAGDEQLAELTSGGVSPTLGAGISMAYVPVPFAKIGTVLDIEIRGKRFPAEVVRKPFV
ncbi:MAG: glycine cleavage system aminomethyltransferase GcvT [Planctomycetaceae bacterium]